MDKLNCIVKIQTILAFVANICTILTFFGVLIAVISFFKNTMSKRHFILMATIEKNPTIKQNDNFYSQSLRIDFINKTTKSFYILNAKIFNGEKWINVYQKSSNTNFAELSCLYINSFEPKIINCFIINQMNLSKTKKLKFAIQTTKKVFVFNLKFNAENEKQKSFHYKRMKSKLFFPS